MEASYQLIDDRPTLRFERRIAHPVESVWSAVTEPSELGQWFPCEVALELRLGAPITFRFPHNPLTNEPLTLTGEVTELDPPRRFSFTWGEDHLHFALEPLDHGVACRLQLTVELDSAEKAARDGAGWHQCLDGLEQLLSGERAARPNDPSSWRAHYDEYRRRGFPATAPLPEGM